MQAVEKEASSLQKEVDKAADHIAKLAEKVKKAEAGQAEAQHKLASAGVEASSARKLVEAVGISHSPLLLYGGTNTGWGPRWCLRKGGKGCWRGSLCNSWACACFIEFAYACCLMNAQASSGCCGHLSCRGCSGLYASVYSRQLALSCVSEEDTLCVRGRFSTTSVLSKG